jgi:hypothetical protein
MRLMGRGGEKTSAAVSETAVSRNQRDLASLIEHGRLFPCMAGLGDPAGNEPAALRA